MTQSEILKRRVAGAEEIVKKGYRRPLDRDKLGGHGGRYQPADVPKGAGPPYKSTRSRKRENK